MGPTSRQTTFIEIIIEKVVSPLTPNKGASPPRLTGYGFWLWQVAGCRHGVGWYQGLRFVSTLERRCWLPSYSFVCPVAVFGQ